MGTNYLTAIEVRRRLGGISNTTLWRYLRDPSLGFPKPVKIRRTRLFPVEEVDAFVASLSARVAQ